MGKFSFRNLMRRRKIIAPISTKPYSGNERVSSEPASFFSLDSNETGSIFAKKLLEHICYFFAIINFISDAPSKVGLRTWSWGP